MKSSLSCLLPLALATALAGCGGGGEEDSAVAATTSGVFRDAPVAGLWFQSATGNSYTSSTGTFPYKPGVTYTFYVGKLKLGSFTPTTDNATVTPANLVAESGSAAARETAILNLVRFLMTLDADKTPANGISISSALDTDALNWAQIDFTSASALTSGPATANMNGIVSGSQTIAKGIKAITGTTSYTSEADARTHLDSSMSCAYSGAFVANRMNGSVLESRVAVLVNADGTGEADVTGLQYFPADAGRFTFSSPYALVYSDLLSSGSLVRDVPSDSDSSVKLRYKHSNSSVDQIFITTTKNGVLASSYQTVGRLAGVPTAVRRFAGVVAVSAASVPADYVYVLEIDSSKVVSGKVQDLRSGASATLTGSYNSTSGSLSATTTVAGRALAFSGNLNTSSDVWTGSLSDAGATGAVAFTSQGCKLN